MIALRFPLVVRRGGNPNQPMSVTEGGVPFRRCRIVALGIHLDGPATY